MTIHIKASPLAGKTTSQSDVELRGKARFQNALAKQLGAPAKGRTKFTASDGSVSCDLAAASGLLGIEQVSPLLDCSCTAVLRLIARRRLAATQLGADGDWRLTAAAVASYVAAGASDYTSPTMGSSWFDDSRIASVANGFIAKVKAAMDGKQLSAEVVASRAEAAIRVDDYQPSITLVEALSVDSSVTSADIPKPSAVFGPMPELSRYRTWSELWAAVAVRATAHRMLSDPMLPGSTAMTPLERLYATPGQYDQIAGAAVDAFLGGVLSVSQAYPNITRRGLPTNVGVRYEIANSALAPSKARLVEVSF